MMHEACKASVANGRNPHLAPQDLPAGRTSPVPEESAAADHAPSSSLLVEQWQQEIQASLRAGTSDEISVLKLVRHVLTHSDQAARSEAEQCLSKIVLFWLRCHPSREIVCRWEGEEHYVEQAFERFWHIVIRGQVRCETLAEVVVCLRASLNGAILERLRVSSRPRAVSNPRPSMEDRPDRSEIWDRLQALLPNQREQRLAYLLYHCGLDPKEIVRCCPQEWSDVQEIYRLRHSLLKRLLNHANLLHSWLNEWEPL